MSEPLHLEIITNQTVVLKTEITDLYIPAFYGEAGILSHHLPYISILKTGELSYREKTGVRYFFFIRNGILEVKENRITIIADAVETEEQLLAENLPEEIEKNEARIKSSFQGVISPDQLEKELEQQKILQAKLAIRKKIACR